MQKSQRVHKTAESADIAETAENAKTAESAEITESAEIAESADIAKNAEDRRECRRFKKLINITVNVKGSKMKTTPKDLKIYVAAIVIKGENIGLIPIYPY